MTTMRTRSAKGSALTHAEVDANFDRSITQKTTTYQVLIGDNRSVIEGNHATVAFTVTLPTVVTALTSETGDFEVTVLNINAAIVSVDGSGSETIDGSTSAVALDQYESVTCKLNSAGTGWATTSKVLTFTSDQTFGGAVTVSGAFTSLGIDDNATAQRLEISDSAITVGPTTNDDYEIIRDSDIGSLTLAGGDTSTAGGNIRLRSGTHVSEAGDMVLRSGSNTFISWDESAGAITISTGTGSKTVAAVIDSTQITTFNRDVFVGDFTQAQPELAIGANATGTPRLSFAQTVNTKAIIQYTDASDIFEFHSDGDIQLKSANTNALTLDTSQVATFAQKIVLGGDTATGDAAAVGYTAGGGLILTGQGSTSDITIKNDADVAVIQIPTGTTNVNFNGKLLVNGDTAANDDAAIGYTAAEGLILTGQGSTNDITIKNDADVAVINIPTGTTNVDIVGNLTSGGDDVVAVPAVITNHVRAGNVQILNGEAGGSIFTLVHTESTFESFGPTAATPDNVWSVMDALPSNATILIVDFRLNLTTLGTDQAKIQLFATYGDDATPAESTTHNFIGNLIYDPNAGSLTIGSYLRTFIPLGTSQDFQLSYNFLEETGATSINMYYRGFITN